MSKLFSFPIEAYPALMATDVADVRGLSRNHNGSIVCNTQKRIILIGLGGQGVRTLDRIKEEILDRFMNPDWWILSHIVSFIAIDSDWHELRNLHFLNQSETVCTFSRNLDHIAVNPHLYPCGWRQLIDREYAEQSVNHVLPMFDHPGSGRYRDVGKLRLYGKSPHDERAKDEQIILKIEASIQELMISPNDSIDVYVIGGISGESGSGMFPEMPSLIHHALRDKPHNIYAMAYLPDTLTGFDSYYRHEFEANGYAALKEINYYQGITMREDAYEAFPSGDPSIFTREVHPDNGFYQIPYLIGTRNGWTHESQDQAMAAVAEAILSELYRPNGNQNPLAVLYPAVHGNVEGLNERHEFPKCYSSVGMTKAGFPKGLLRSYAIGQMFNGTEAEQLFCNDPPLLNVEEGNRVAMKLVDPIVRTINDILKQRPFSLENFLQVPNEEQYDFFVQNREYRQPHIHARIEREIGDYPYDHIEDLHAGIRQAYLHYSERVKNYIYAHGPAAFYNLFSGNFYSDHSEIPARGIRDILKNLCNGMEPDGSPPKSLNVIEAETRLTEVEREFEQYRSFLGRMRFLIMEGAPCQRLFHAYDDFVNARIQERLRRFLLSANCWIEELTHAIARMAERINAFGGAVKTIVSGYKGIGNGFANYQNLLNQTDDPTEINLAGMAPLLYQFVKDIIDQHIQSIPPAQISHGLIEHFWEHQEAWMEIDDYSIMLSTGFAGLRDPYEPVIARRFFDEHINAIIGPWPPCSCYTILSMIDLNQINIQQFVQRTVNRLIAQSGPLINATGRSSVFEMQYPSELNQLIIHGNSVGSLLVQEMQAQVVGHNFTWSAVQGLDCIVLKQFATPFEIYRISELPCWERAYEDVLPTPFGQHLHIGSPISSMPSEHGEFVEIGVPWEDFPAITIPSHQHFNDRKQAIQTRLHGLIENARELGILYSLLENDGYRIFCVTRLPNIDRALLREIACGEHTIIENAFSAINEDIARYSKVLRLRNGGVMDWTTTLEDLAWVYAERILQANPRLLHRVQKMVDSIKESIQGL